MFRTTILNIFESIWPMLIIITIILSSLRIGYLLINKQKFVFYKEMLMLGFIIYIMSLFYVVTFQDVSWSDSNFIPFKEMFRYRFGSNLFLKNVLGNMVMFLPFGFFASYFLKLTKQRYIFLFSVIASVTIEVTQLFIGRVFDIDDVILNVIGGILGFYLYTIVSYIRSKFPNFLKNNVVYNIIMILVLVVIVMYLTSVIR